MSKERTYERRYVTGDLELRSGIGRKQYVEGYAAVFGKRALIAGLFEESVGPSAFNKTVGEADVRALFNHDPSKVLGRNKAGTLELSIDNSGLYYRASIPDTSYGRDLAELLDRRDVTQSSFGFWTVQDHWDDGDTPHRSLVEVGLLDVSPVTYPAYEDATSALTIRSAAMVGLAHRSGCTPGDLCNITAIRSAIEKEPPLSTREPSTDTRDAGTLIAKAKERLAALDAQDTEFDWA